MSNKFCSILLRVEQQPSTCRQISGGMSLSTLILGAEEKVQVIADVTQVSAIFSTLTLGPEEKVQILANVMMLANLALVEILFC